MLVTELELYFLHACQDVVIRQQEIALLLARGLEVAPEELFYYWAIPPHPKQTDLISGTNWKYFFHGLECNIKNDQDGRFLRLDFGPHGRLDTFSGFGVLQFVMTSLAPWHEYPALKGFLAKGLPPYNELSGSHQKMRLLESHLEELGLVEVADPELCALVEKYTFIQPDGSRITALPREYSDFTQRAYWDTRVCNRLVIAELGRSLLANSS